MRWVDHPRLFPGRCAVMPQVPANHPDGFIDTGNRLQSGDHVYVSVVAARIMAEALGYKRAGDTAGQAAEITRLKGQLDQAQAKIEEQDEQLEAVHVLKRGGFATSKKPGRPPAVKVEV